MSSDKRKHFSFKCSRAEFLSGKEVLGLLGKTWQCTSHFSLSRKIHMHVKAISKIKKKRENYFLSVLHLYNIWSWTLLSLCYSTKVIGFIVIVARTQVIRDMSLPYLIFSPPESKINYMQKVSETLVTVKAFKPFVSILNPEKPQAKLYYTFKRKTWLFSSCF